MNYGIAPDMMVIIEDKYQRFLDRAENFIDKQVGRAFRMPEDVFAGLGQIREDGVTEIGNRFSNAVRNIPKKNSRVSIRMIKLVPDRGPNLTTHKIGDQCCLAAPGIGSYEC